MHIKRAHSNLIHIRFRGVQGGVTQPVNSRIASFNRIEICAPLGLLPRWAFTGIKRVKSGEKRPISQRGWPHCLRLCPIGTVTLSLFLASCVGSAHQMPISPPLADGVDKGEPMVLAPTDQPSRLSFDRYETELATIYVVTVPATYTVTVAASETLQSVETFAEETGAAVVLNAGFFDPMNGQTTSHVVVNGVVFADPADNERLVNNPDLTEYLAQILHRSEFRQYDCDDGTRYEIAPRNGDFPMGCTLSNVVGGGPQLLPTDTSLAEAFTAVDENGQLVRDAIGSLQRNARSAVGLRADGTVLLVMVSQQEATNSGMTLAELTAFMQAQGVKQALNLDGGSSSSLLFEGEAFYGRLNSDEQSVMRPIKSVLIVKP